MLKSSSLFTWVVMAGGMQGGRLYLQARKLLSTSIAGERSLFGMGAKMSGKVLFSHKNPPADMAG